MLNSYREQIGWGVLAAALLGAFYLGLSRYTSDLEKPTVFIRIMFSAHIIRLIYSVKDDLNRHSPKLLALLNISAVAAVCIAMLVRPAFFWMLGDLETDPWIREIEKEYREYAAVLHNPVFGITAFFVAAYVLCIKAIRRIGNKFQFLEFPRSSYEKFGAFYEAANSALPPSTMVEIEEDAKNILAQYKGVYPVPITKYLTR